MIINKCILWIFCFCILICTFSCSSSNFSEKKYKDELFIGTIFPIGKIAPLSNFGISSLLAELVYAPLFRLGKNNEIIPVLAENVVWEENKTNLRVFLKSISAEDVKKSFELHLKNNIDIDGPSNGNKLKIEIVSNNEIIFHFPKYDRYLLMKLRAVLIKAYSKKDKTTGSFIIVKESRNFVRLKRKKESKKKIKYISVKLIPIQRHAIRDLVSGSLDLLLYPNKGDYDLVNDIPNIKIDYFSNTLLYMMMENQEHKNTSTKAVDWGKVNSLINRAKFTELYDSEVIRKAPYPVLKESNWFDKSFYKNEANLQYKVMPRVERNLTFIDSRGKDERIALLVKRELQPFGVDIKLNKVSSEQFQTEVSINKSYDLALIQISMRDIFLYNYLFFHSSSQQSFFNMTKYKNEQVDGLLERARYESSFDKARKHFVEAMNIILKDPPGVFLFWVKLPVLYSTLCKGFDFESPDFFFSLKDVECTQEVH